MRSWLNVPIILILTACFALVCPATETPDPNRYLNAVREFADNVLKYGRDTYGPKHTPLFVDGLNIHTREPVKWIDPDGTRWILSNFASQQTLLRTLDGLTALTGDPKYRQAAMDAIRYEFDHVRTPGGLFYWGHITAYDALGDTPRGNTSRESIKLHYPYYELMWKVGPEGTKKLIEALWCAHVMDWSNLDFNRIGITTGGQEEPWNHEYNEEGPTFFKSKFGGCGFFHTASSLAHAGTILHKLTGEEPPLLWSKRLIRRFVDTRHPKTGISAMEYNDLWLALGEDMKEHFVDPRTAVFPWDFDEFRYLYYPENAQAQPWISVLLIGEMLDNRGKEFTTWVLEELTAWGKVSYRKEDNTFVPTLTDGTGLEGYTWKPGMVIKAYSADPSFFWAYSVAYRTTGNEFMWEMSHDICLGNGFGDIGKTPVSTPKLLTTTSCSNVYGLLGFLELYKKTSNSSFLEMAQRIGDNIVNNNFHKGFFVLSKSHIYTRFDCSEPLALLHLVATIKSESVSVPQVWPSCPLFVPAYRYKQEGVDRRVIYALAESPEPPLSLQEAAAIGDVNMVNSLLEKGIGVDSWDDSLHKTALQRAAMNGHREAVELLLDKGAQIDAQDWWPGGTALDYAAEKGHKEVAELLIARGANINAKREWPVGDRPLHSAARAGRKEVVELLIDKGADVDAKNNDGRSPLDMAIARNRPAIAKLLIEKGADVTSLHIAAQYGLLEKVRSIIEAGSNVNLKDGRQRTPLHYAAEEDHKDVVELLLEKGADVNTGSYYNRTAAEFAMNRRHTEIVELLIANGADISPLHLAIYLRDEARAKSLIENGADVNKRTSYGTTPLGRAVNAGFKDLVRLLLDRGADVNAKDNWDWTPLHSAVYQDKAIVELLIARGANVNAEDGAGRTPLWYAQKEGYTEIVELLQTHMLLHDIAITNVSVPSTCIQGDTVPVMVSVTNEGDHTEAFRIALFDTVGNVEIAGREMTLESQRYKSANAADLILSPTSSGQGNFGWGFNIHGDVNRDGYDDLLIGASLWNENHGRAYLYFGGADMDGIPDLIFEGEEAGDYLGDGGAALGDVNGDGYDDVIIGARGYHNNDGRLYIFFGGIDMDKEADVILDGESEKTGYFSCNCLSVGDVDKDGYADVLVGACGYDRKRGRVYLYYGGDPMDSSADVVFDGERTDDFFGRNATIGQDIDGDGYRDILIGARQAPEGTRNGHAYLFYGGDKNQMDAVCDLTFTPPAGRPREFGSSLDIYDIDSDGHADVVIGARLGQGAVFVYWGDEKDKMNAVVDVTILGEDGAKSSLGGDKLFCADFNRDGYGDIAVGAYNWLLGKRIGRTYIYCGGTKTSIDTQPDVIFNGEIEDGWFGHDIGGGDFNNDGYTDLVAGAWLYNNKEGRAYVFYAPFEDKTEVAFNWDTTNTSIGKHTLKVEIPPVPGEQNTDDNIKTMTIEVKEPPK